MKTLLPIFWLGFTLLACGSQETPDENQNESLDTLSTQNQAPKNAIDPQRSYPFLELKKLYAQDWQGEEAGNPALDGETVKLEGKVYNVSRLSRLEGNQVILQAIKIEFRAQNPGTGSFAHDVECHFPAQMIVQIEEIAPDSLVQIQGRLFGQEITIAGDSSYTTLILKDCELL